MRTVLKKIVKVIKSAAIALLLAIIVWCCVSNVLDLIEKRNNPAPGVLVDVDGGNMHVYLEGSGEETIVLLAGLGTAAPAADFKPLINVLSDKYKVAVVECFGYGWSGLTDKKRTIDNVVDEIRQALNEAGADGPYILMPHSYSGIYGIYYANKYPGEIKAFIGNDCMMPIQIDYFDGSYPKVSKAMSLIAPTGLARLMLMLSPEGYVPEAGEGVYLQSDIDMIKMISGWKGYNRNVVEEMNEVESSVGKTLDMTFPGDLPVLFFMMEGKEKREDAKTLHSMYEKYLTANTASDIVVLEGHHFLHWANSETMGDAIDGFVDKIKNNNITEE